MAQSRLNSACYLITNEALVIPKLVELLKQDSNLHHEQFKVFPTTALLRLRSYDSPTNY